MKSSFFIPFGRWRESRAETKGNKTQIVRSKKVVTNFMTECRVGKPMKEMVLV